MSWLLAAVAWIQFHGTHVRYVVDKGVLVQASL
jgi:hypothetical protein